MDKSRHGGALIFLSAMAAIISFTLWPPYRAESKTQKIVEVLNTGDSLARMTQVEFDLFRHKQKIYEKTTTATDTAQ